MFDFEHTSLWRATLARQSGSDPHEGPRGRLREAFLAFRARAETLAHEIPRDLPTFTVHDITHLDALWEIASTISGPDFSLTPSEGFVLGGAFLVHDLAMSLAAMPGGLSELKREKVWMDAVSAQLRRKLGRVPLTKELENPGRDVELKVIEELLRLLHARQAERLATAEWAGLGQAKYYLIDSPDLRSTFGPTIGKIAHSHWWPVDKLPGEFAAPLGPPADCPSGWNIDRLKLACLLRVADAAHLDERRAPGFLFALRKPEGVAAAHWTFQNKLLKPRREGDRLVFSVKSPFAAHESAAWWTCFDAVRGADRELRQADDLLADLHGSRFAVRSVANIDSPQRFAKAVGTEGWLPVEATVKVGNVVALARNIGGEQLYGDNRAVPLRELIQNASDAVRARRILENRPSTWGDILVRVWAESNHPFIEVQDTGVGMSVDVLTGVLLDFGGSYWGSELMREEQPGLLGKGFQSTGRFGIGFFSVFMWGDNVSVTTRRADDGKQQTRVLEFENGLESRPMLRYAKESEQLLDAGTVVRVRLKRDPVSEGGFLHRPWRPAWKLEDLCAWMCPSLDANLYVEADGRRTQALAASDWTSLDGAHLMKRLALHTYDEEDESRRHRLASLFRIAANYRLLTNARGELLGRAAIMLDCYGGAESYLSSVTIGGFQGQEISHISGILLGQPGSAVRDRALPVVDPETLAAWASEQADLLYRSYTDPVTRGRAAALVISCGGDPGGLPVARTAAGWLTLTELAGAFAGLARVRIVTGQLSIETGPDQNQWFHGHEADVDLAVQLEHDVLWIASDQYGVSLRGGGARFGVGMTNDVLLRAAAEVFARLWNCDAKELLASASQKERQEVGRMGSARVFSEVRLFANLAR